jgi:hypothetical protein
MSLPSSQPHAGDPSAFSELMTDVLSRARRFSHRQHVELTWLAVRRYGTAAAIPLVSEGIKHAAAYSSTPRKYNATISRAWVEMVGHHAEQHDAATFDDFADRHPALLDKRLLIRFYRPATLASPAARTGWVPPDRAPFPWRKAPGTP